MCTIVISVSRSNISEKSSLRRREHFLSLLRSHTGGERCCERCGTVEWIINEGENFERHEKSFAVTIIEQGNAWVKKVTDGITPSTRSLILTFRAPFDL